MTLVVLASAWKQISYNFLFLFAALLAVPRSILEAAAVGRRRADPPLRVDLAADASRRRCSFSSSSISSTGCSRPSPVVDATTRGGPAGATTTLVYKVYLDGFVSLDLGSSAAQSLILMALALALTFAQFRFIERRVSYARLRHGRENARSSTPSATSC